MDDQTDPGRRPDPALADELRELGQSLAALGRTAFKGGRVLSAELLRSIRSVVDQARDEIDRMTGERKPRK